ncbi:MAG TPA: hypothetical protein DCF49_04250 [Lachnospiraceae bacterium]|jgi:hypothetical protein|nr:hypothetical protein [Lachnospiraceae bacterium]
MIKGTTVTLYEKTQAGTDPFGHAIYVRVPATVENVLVAQPSGQERVDEKNLTGRSIDYVLGIPKGDTHNWEDQIVEFFGHKFQTFGIPEEGIEDNVPGPWHKKVKCERYE